MKKKKTEGKKPQEFASRPFSPLKGVRTVLQNEPSEPGGPLPGPEQADDDVELFLRAVADARRLHPAQSGRKEGREQPPNPPPASQDEERAVFLRALENLQLDVSFRDELPGEQEQAKPLGVNRLRQLRRGTIRLDLQLDLHGLTRDVALQGLEAFLVSARNRGQKAVLVITGKGNRSAGEPVLQGAVTAWLRVKGKGIVAEFAPAPRELGGSGAFVVFLKEKLQD